MYNKNMFRDLFVQLYIYMSLVTLKRKTQAKYRNNSVGFSNFSLVGNHRSQGWVGQTTLSRSLPKTVMVGNVAKGYGGCCGEYVYGPIVNNAVISQNNPNVTKTSTMTTSGLLENNYSQMVISGPQSCSTWKPDYNSSLNKSQSSYITYVKEEALEYANSDECAVNADKNSACCYEDVATNEENVNTMSQSEYLAQMKSQCYNSNYNIFYVPNNLTNNFTFCGAK
tara:strand:- start:2001 stop:2675 length:675 start_codon:yes stop_codon:yes gene_type:complete